jgi:2-keto-4-pentenoate hydratase/2-oxohepta-3-ene-1,7-dioic acid hydratase in catechol pathway
MREGTTLRIGRVEIDGAVYLARFEDDVEHDAVVLLAREGDRPTSDAFRDVGPELSLEGPGLRRVELSDVVVLRPLRKPQTIWAVGLNYVDHAEESGLPVPQQPVYFIKATSSLLDPGAAIEFNAATVLEVDAEVELAVVIGATVGPRTAEPVADAIFGYTVANDISAREMQFREGQWCHSKSIDTFCPLGPWIVAARHTDLAARMTSTVNGAVLQNGRLDDMIAGPVAIVEHLSSLVTLERGDVVLTGTPAGVGFSRTPPVTLADGDRVTVSISGIGELDNVVRCR